MTGKWEPEALRRQVHRRDQGAARRARSRPARPRRSSRSRRRPRARGTNVIDLAELLKKSLGKRGAARPTRRRRPGRRPAAHRPGSPRKGAPDARRSGAPAVPHGATDCARTTRSNATSPSATSRSPPSRRAAAPKRRKALSFVIQKHWATPAALRLPARARRRAAELGGAEGPELRPGRQAHGDPRRGPSVSLRRLRGHDPAEAVRRRHASSSGTAAPGSRSATRARAWPRASWSSACTARSSPACGSWCASPSPATRRTRGCCSRSGTSGRGRSPTTTSSAALPDSVVAKPLGPVEEREPRGRGAARRAARGAATSADLARRGQGRAAGEARAAARDAGRPRAGAGDWIYEIKFDGYRADGAHRERQGAPRHARRPRLDGEDARRSPPRVEALGIDSRLARRRDRRARRRRRARLQRAAERHRLRARTRAHRLLPLRRAVLRRPRPARACRCRRGARCSSELLDAQARPTACASAQTSPPTPAQHAAGGAASMGLEGVIAKRADAPYVSRRTETWLKLKCQQRQEFVDRRLHRPQRRARRGRRPAARRATSDGELRYAGNVGTGWDARTGRGAARAAREARGRQAAPFDAGDRQARPLVRRAAGGERWVEPQLVAEVAFARVDARRPRSAMRSFQGLRSDKPAQASVTRDGAQPPTPPAPAAGRARAAAPAAIKVTQSRARHRSVAPG